MNNVKKTIALVLSILVILAFTTFSNASTITARNSTETEASPSSESGNESEKENGNEVENEPENTQNNNTSNNLAINNTAKAINTSNSTQNLPNTGLDSTEINFALILLLTLVFGMFSLVQYNKIVKKDEE